MPSLQHVSFLVSRSLFSPVPFPLPLSSCFSQDRWIRLVRNELRIEHKAAQFKVSILPPAHSLPFPLPPSLPPFLSLSHTLPAPCPLFCSCPLPMHAYGSPSCFLSAQINQKAGIKPCPSEVQAAVREAESETSFNPVKCECRRVLYFSHAFLTFVSDSLRII